MNLSPVARSRTFSVLVFLGIALGLVLPMTEARADYFYTVTPCRAYDSRPGKPDAPQLDANSKRTIKLTERCGVPADASAVAANVTLVGANGEGHVVVFEGPASKAQPNPPVGTIPFRREQTVPARANNVFIPLAADGSGTANILPVMVPAGAKLGVIVDVVGFFRKPPIAQDDTATVAEDSGATTIDVRANDLAAGSPAFSISSVTQPANGTVAITNAGQDLTYTPNANYCNTPPGTTLDTFTYTLTPTGSTATVSVTVTCEDDDPTAVDDTATVAENDPATTIDVLANDDNADGGPISIDSVTQPANGTVVITNGGADLTYEPNPGYCNDPPGTTPDTFTYTLTPGGDTATVSVTVTCTDDEPTAVNDSATVAEDSGANTINVLANDTDPDGGPISIDSVTQPVNGTVAITNGGADLTYTPNADYCNTPPGTTLDTFTYTLTPGGSSATVTVTVTCGDDNPVAVNDAATVTEDSGANAIDVLANDTDGDGGPISVASVTQPANGTVVITGGGTGLTYQPNANYCNTPPGTTLDTFTYTLTPGTSTATVTVTVNCEEDDPVAVNDAATVAEDSGANAIDVLANDTDVDGGAMSVQSVTQPANGTVAITGGGTGVSYTPNADYCNTPPGTTLDTFTYTLTPGGSSTTVTVSVTCVDDDPTAVADAATVAEDSGANAIDVLANDTDPDAGPKSVQSVTQPANGAVAITGGGTGVSYTPNANYCNTPPGTTLETFTYTLTPGGSSTSVTVTVTCVDDNPTAVADAATVTEDSANNPIDVLANDTDPDGGSISVQSVTQPANGAVAITGGGTGVSYTPNANYCNTPPGTTLETFTYTLTPGGSSTTVTVSVTCVDDDPTAVADAATVLEDSVGNAIDVLANDTDPDAGPKSVQSVTQPANGTVAITGGGTGVSYTPNANYCNTPPGTTLETFTYTLTPGGSSTTVTVTVTCVDDPPVAVNDSTTVNEDSGANTIAVLANDTDPDGGPISVQSVTQPGGGAGTTSVAPGGAGVIYTPSANFCNLPPGTTPVTFTYTLTPGSSSATVSVLVQCINDAPVLVDNTLDYTILGNTQLRVGETTPGASLLHIRDNADVLEKAQPSDIDGPGPLQVVPFSGNTGKGDLVLNADGTFTYEPNAGFEGTDVINIQVTDNALPTPGLTPATLTITVSRMVWFVHDVTGPNNPAAGDTGRSTNAFEVLSEAVSAAEADAGDNDYIFVFEGNTNSGTPHTGGFTLNQNGVKLLGEAAGLDIPGFGALIPAGNRPRISNTAVTAGEDNGVNVVNTGGSFSGIEIRGLQISATDNAIDVTATGANNLGITIWDNTITTTAAEGIDVNANSTGTVTVDADGNTLAGGTNGFDARTAAAGQLRINFSNHTNILANGTGVLIDGSFAGSNVTITGFGNNTVHQNTAGTGVSINAATFDQTPGGGFNQVAGGTTVVGTPGDGVGGSGVVMTNVQGNLFFTDLDIFASAGAGLRVTGTGSGMTFGVSPAVAIVQATGGPAVDVASTALTLPLTSLTSTNSPSTGVALNSITGTFSAGSGSTITGITNASGTAFQVGNSNATVSYAGTITTTQGKGVDLTTNTGSTISFTGTLTLGSLANTAFNATGGGTVTTTDTASTLTSTTGTALNVASTTIGADGLRFRSISAGTAGSGPTNGIVLNATGSLGGLTVSGGGNTGLGGDSSGGTIQRTTGDAISLTNTRNVSLTNVRIQNIGTGSGDGAKGIEASNLAGSNYFRYGTITGLGQGGGADRNGIDIRNTNTDLTLFSVENSSFSNSDSGTSFILAFAQGTSNMRLDVKDSDFSDLVALAVQASAGNTEDVAHTMTTNITGNTFRNASPADGQGGVAVTVAEQAATHNFTISNNTFIDLIKGIAGGNSEILLAQTTGGNLVGTIANNVIGNATAGNGDRRGIGVIAEPDVTANGELGSVDIIIEGNTIDRLPNREAIFVDLREDTQSSELIIRNNNIGQLAGFLGLVGGDLTKVGAQREAIDVQTRGEVTRTLNLLLSGNNVRANTSVNVVNLEVNIDNATPGNLTMHATVTGNTFRNDDAAGSAELIARPRDAGAVTTLCLDMTGNTIDGGAGQIDLNETGVLNVEQASQAGLATANGIPSGNVLITGTAPSFGVACMAPPS